MLENWLALTDDVMINLDQLTLVRFGEAEDGTPYCLLWFTYAVEQEDDGRMTRNALRLTGFEAGALYFYMHEHVSKAKTPDEMKKLLKKAKTPDEMKKLVSKKKKPDK